MERYRDIARRVALVGSIVAAVPLADHDIRRALAFQYRLWDVRSISETAIPELGKTDDPLKTALLLRDGIYRLIPLKKQNNYRYNSRTFADIYRKSLLDPDYGHICGGLVIQYLVALRAFGIPARKVGLYPDVDPFSGNSHASAEVWIKGRWIAMDPTFNVSLHDTKGRRVSWQDAREMPGQIKASTDGFRTIRTSFEDYAKASKITLKDWTRFMNFGPSPTSKPATLPASWDGVLRYPDSNSYDALTGDSAGIYSTLAR